MKLFKYYFLLVVSVILIFSACSSVPKSTGEVFVIRKQAEEGMEKANKHASQGNYDHALLLINDYKRMAILADDPSLIIRCSLVRGNILFSLGRVDEALAEWDMAIAEAFRDKNLELLSVSRVFKARGNLLSNRASAQSVYDEVNRESANIKNYPLYIAFSWQVKGLAFRSLSLFREAEDAIRRSLAIHEKEKSLENVSFDWYTIASIRSLAGLHAGAIEALEKSIEIDRKIENSWGLAVSWRAKGDVYRNAGRQNEALDAYGKARTIFAAMRNDHEVAETDKKIRN